MKLAAVAGPNNFLARRSASGRALLLAGTALCAPFLLAPVFVGSMPIAAHAEGGDGSAGIVPPGGAGGADNTDDGGTGVAGGPGDDGGGGGGGAGETGGAGGDGGSTGAGTGGAGGAGGTQPPPPGSRDGDDGGNATGAGASGGGGGGGAHGFVGDALPTDPASGGDGGNGGIAGTGAGGDDEVDGGGGGAGGYGAVVTGDGNLGTLEDNVSAGDGGDGGDGNVRGGNGGSGGIGLLFTSLDDKSVTISANVIGGDGGNGGNAGGLGTGGAGGDGGDGLSGSNMTINIEDLISAGDGGDGGNAGNLGTGGAGGAGGSGITGDNLTITINANNSDVTAGGGGDGGNAGNLGTGGAGGAGGSGITGDNLTITIDANNSEVTGGDGGDGGDAGGLGTGGAGGAGGAGIDGDNLTITLDAAVTGGAGGDGGSVGALGTAGADGAGGVGIIGENLTITMEDGASISGGLGLGGRAYAINFTGGANTINLADDPDPADITGGINIATLTTSLELATAAGVEAEIDQIISGLGSVEKTGEGTVTLSAINTYTGLTTVSQGTLVNEGTIAGAVNNSATFNNDGTVTGLLTNEDGTTTNDGTLNGGASVTGGELVNNALGVINGGATVSDDGTLTTTGTINGGLVVNSATATVFAEGDIFGAISNGGIFNLTGDLNGDSLFTNSGVFNSSGTRAVTGITGFSNTGTISMQNGATGDQLTLAGTYTGGAGSTLDIDVDLSDETNPLGDLLVLGDTQGTTTVNFNSIGTQSLIDPLRVIDTADGDLNAVMGTGLPPVGLILYDLVEMGNDWFVISQLNLAPIGGIVGGISTAQALINTTVNRPTSPFVSPPVDVAANTCAPGGYGRLFGGTANAETTTTSPVSDPASSEIDLNYAGAQIGVDFGCFNLGDSGAAVNVGLLGGVNIGKSKQDQPVVGGRLISDNEFDSRYFGAYATYLKGAFFSDLQVTYDRTDFEIDSFALVGGNPVPFVDGQTPGSERLTVSGSTGYAFALNGISVVPSVGFAYSHTSTDTIGLEQANGRLIFHDLDSFVGFASVAVARTIVLANQTSAIQPFVTATVYSDFGDDQEVTFTDDTHDVLTTTDNLGTFGELSAGLNYRTIIENGNAGLRELAASIRADLTFSDRVLGGRLVGQMRLQF